MKLEGEGTVRVDQWGRILFVNVVLPKPMRKEEATRIHDKRVKVSMVVIE